MTSIGLIGLGKNGYEHFRNKEQCTTGMKVDNEISLRKLSIHSAEIIFNKIRTSKEHLGQWLPWVRQLTAVEEVEDYIKQTTDSVCPKKDHPFEIWYKNDFAGIITLKEVDQMNRKSELGYWLIKEYEGKGLMIRSCEVILDYAFEMLELNKIQIKCSVENIRSCNIPKQLKFSFEGIEREGELLQNRFVDLKVYSLLKKEWMRHHAAVEKNNRVYR